MLEGGVNTHVSSAVPNTQLAMDNERLGQSTDERGPVQKLLDQYGDPSSVPLTALLLLVGIALLNAISRKLVQAAQQLSANADRMKALSEELADLDKLKGKQGTAKSTDGIPDSDQLKKVKEILSKEGISVSNPMTWGDLDGASSEMKSKSDAASNLNSQFQLSVQNTNSQLTNANDFASNGISKMWQSLQTITGNMR